MTREIPFPEPVLPDVSAMDQLLKAPRRRRLAAPSPIEMRIFELNAVEHCSQRDIVKMFPKLKLSQSKVSRICAKAKEFVALASREQFEKLSAEEELRAAIRLQCKKQEFTEREILRQYRKSQQPQKWNKERELTDKGWKESGSKERTVDPLRCLESFHRISQKGLCLPAQRFPVKMDPPRDFPEDASQQHDRDKREYARALIEELEFLREEYLEMMRQVQRVYGYLNKDTAPRPYLPACPIGGWVSPEDLSLRRDQPGVLSGFEKDVYAEELYGPAGEWTVDAWLDRKWRKRYGDRPRFTTGKQRPIQVAQGGNMCGARVQKPDDWEENPGAADRRDSVGRDSVACQSAAGRDSVACHSSPDDSDPYGPGPQPLTDADIPEQWAGDREPGAGAMSSESLADKSESPSAGDSPRFSENLRENRGDSRLPPQGESESKSESVGRW